MTVRPGHHSEFVVRCTCGETFNTSDSHLGKRLKCRCGRTVLIARPTESEAAAFAGQSRPRPEASATRTKSRHRRRQRTPGAQRLGNVKAFVGQWLRPSQYAQYAQHHRTPWHRWLSRLGWASCAATVAAWLLLITTSEVFLPATLLAYGPRYFLLAPFAVLVPLAFVRARRALLPLGLGLAMVLGPIMGGRAAWQSAFSRLPLSAPPGALRVVSYNAQGGLRVANTLREMVAALHPDVVALQECGDVMWDSVQVVHEFFHARAGGVCSMSRWPIVAVDSMPRADIARAAGLGYGGAGIVVRTRIASPFGQFDFVNVHLETARKGLFAFLGNNSRLLALLGVTEMRSRRVLNARGTAEDRFEANAFVRNRESERAARWSAPNADVPVIVAGDFNMPTESTIFRRHFGSFTDAFEATGTGFGWSKNEGALLHIRIDHVLSTRTAPRPIGTWLGADYGSDHRPVIADLAWAAKRP